MKKRLQGEDKSINAVPSYWEGFKSLLKEYNLEVFIVVVFMLFFFGGMAVFDQSAYPSALFGIFMTVVLFSSALHRD